MILVLFLSGQPACSANPEAQQRESCCGAAPGECGENTPDEHHNDCSGCNPFQSCSCCVVGIVVPAATLITDEVHPVFIPGIVPGSVHQSLTDVNCDGIWQPPRDC